MDPKFRPNFAEKRPEKRPRGLGWPIEPERGPPAPTQAAPTRAGAWVGRRVYKYGAPAGSVGGLFQGFRRIGGAASGAPDSHGHPTGAVPIPHTTTRALLTEPPTAAVHTRTVRGRPRVAGAERFFGMLPSVSQAFLPSQTPNFAQISPKRAPKSPHGGLRWSPEPERGPPAPTRAAPTRAGAWVGRRVYKYGAPAGCVGGPSLDECANSRKG